MTTDVRLLAEDLLLLAWNADSGRPHGSLSAQLAPAIGGALLLDLALRDRLRMEVDVPRASARPTGDDLLDDIAQELRDGPRRHKLKRWVSKVGTTARRDQVRDRLVAQGLLAPEQRKVLGLFPVNRHRLTEPGAVERLAAEVRRVLAGGHPPDARTTALVALVGATAVLDQLVPRGERAAARDRAKELADSSPVAAAARAVIRDTEAAMAASFAGAAGAAAGR
jgi:golgi phosphoprotein 3